MKNAPVVSHVSEELVSEASARAALDTTYRALFVKADHAGKVAGASVNATDAAAYWAELADKMSPCAAYAASVGGPVTTQAIAQAGELDASASAAFVAALDKCQRDTVTPEQGGKVHALRETCRDTAGAFALLDEFRALCGLVSVGCQAAQKAARLTAIQECKAAEIAKRAKLARDKIIKRLDRALAIYGLKVDWQAASATVIEAKEDAVETDADKAAKALANAFKLDASAAIVALCQLEPALLTTIGAAIAQAQKVANINTLKEGAEHAEDTASDLVGKLGKGPVDLVSVANAQEQADIAAGALSKAQSKRKTA